MSDPNTEGPSGTYGCACVDHDAVRCAAIRYGMDHYGEPCMCPCHQWGDDETDDWADDETDDWADGAAP